MEQNTDNFIRYSRSPLIWCPQDWTGVAISDFTKILRPAIRECALISCFHFIMKKLNLSQLSQAWSHVPWNVLL